MSDEVTLNGQLLTESELNQKKEEIEKQKGISVVEVSNGEYRTRLQD